MILQQKQFAKAFMKNGFVHSFFAKQYYYAKPKYHFDRLLYADHILRYRPALSSKVSCIRCSVVLK